MIAEAGMHMGIPAALGAMAMALSTVSVVQEEKKAKEEKDAVIAAAKKRGAEKAKLTKSLIIMDVKPWDDTTGALLRL